MIVVAALGAAWVLAELVLQAWQWARGGPGSSWEWRSFLVLLVAGTLAGTVAPRLAEALPWPGRSVALLVIGVVVAMAGIALRLWSIVALGRFFRGVVNVQDDQYVVRTGPYRMLRHPSYAGALVGITGFMIADGNLAALVFVLVVVGLGLAYRIRTEERVLDEALGTAYERYAAETARLVPGMW